MFRTILIICSLMLAQNAVAQSYAALPTLFAVTGVATDDTLNIRNAPDASSQDIGDLLPGQIVEVMRLDPQRKWAMIIWLEGNGWVSKRFLTPLPEMTAAGTSLPAPLMCSGTEPFWSADIDAGGDLIFGSIDGSTLRQAITGSAISLNYGFYAYGLTTADFTASLRREYCDDGMSDREYGWGLQLLDRRNGQLELLSGCCQLTAP